MPFLLHAVNKASELIKTSKAERMMGFQEAPLMLQAAAKTHELIHEGKEATDKAFARTKQTTQQVRLACLRPSRQQLRQSRLVVV